MTTQQCCVTYWHSARSFESWNFKNSVESNRWRANTERKHIMNDTKLIDAVKAVDHGEVERLIKSGAEVNQQDDQGWTPLNFAAGKGELSLVRLLVESGADVFNVGRDRRTPYDIALCAGRVSVVKYLREIEDQFPEKRPPRPERKYCKAYYLRDLRRYSEWSESRINWKKRKDDDGDGNGHPNDSFHDEKIV